MSFILAPTKLCDLGWPWTA